MTERREQFSPLNTEGFPDKLKKQLAPSTGEARFLEIFRQGGGVLNVSEVLVAFYKIYGEIKTREYVVYSLHRLRKKGLFKRTGKKGEYAYVGRGNGATND